MGNIWNTRATVIERDTGGRVTWTWNQQIVQPAAWVIPKGSPNVANAQKFIASTQNVDSQIQLLDAMANGPASPQALPKLTKEQDRINPTSHLENSVMLDNKWYATEYGDAMQRWVDAIGG